MCLIAVSKKGTQKYSDFFLNAIRKAAISNTDGIGYSFKRANANKVWISKGFQDVEKLITCLKHKRLKDHDELMVHLRIGNKGSKTTDMNHPFVLSNRPDEILSNESYINNITMCHNGTFHDYSSTGSLLSDTYFFVKDFMSVKEIQDLLKRDVSLFTETFKNIVKTNKLAFIFNDNTPMVILGDFIEDEGYFFSNKSYKESRYTNIGGSEYDFDYTSRRRDVLSQVGLAQRAINFPELEDNDDLAEQRELSRNNREAILKEIDKNRDNLKKLTHIGTRQRNEKGLLSVDGKFDIVASASAEHIQEMNSFRFFYEVFNKSLYVPLWYIHDHFSASKFMPSFFNYKHFTLLCTTGDSDRRIIRNTCYEILNFDQSLKGLHTIVPIAENISNIDRYSKQTFITQQDIIRMFTVRYKSKEEDYKTVFRLIQKYRTPSKNLCTRLDKVITSSIAKKKTINITFKQLSGLTLEGLKIYQNYMILDLYNLSVAYKFIRSVQESSVLVN